VARTLALVSGFGVWSVFALAQQPGQTPPGQRGGPPAIQPTSNNVPATQPQPSAPVNPTAGTRVAVVNINKVLKDYQKAQKLNNDIKADVQQFAQRMEQKKAAIAGIQTEMSKPTTNAVQREQFDKQIVNIQRELQDLDAEARKVISKKQGDIALQIFREIEAVIAAVAKSNGFDLVLSYPDATESAERYSQDNIVRMLASQGAMPLFYKPHIDMTKAVVDTLNLSYPVAAGMPAGAPGAPPK
jgi:Skp family chaperone for outer membrane proteins